MKDYLLIIACWIGFFGTFLIIIVIVGKVKERRKNREFKRQMNEMIKNQSL